jgi:hypothetical protein
MAHTTMMLLKSDVIIGYEEFEECYGVGFGGVGLVDGVVVEVGLHTKTSFNHHVTAQSSHLVDVALIVTGTVHAAVFT